MGRGVKESPSSSVILKLTGRIPDRGGRAKVQGAAPGYMKKEALKTPELPEINFLKKSYYGLFYSLKTCSLLEATEKFTIISY